MPKPINASTSRRVALCYKRKSIVRTGTDYASIELQHAAIESFCQRREWVCEWYEDAEGHSSGRSEDGRPNWQRLKQRIADADIVAVVGYRLDRIARSVRDISALLELCEGHGIGVVTADGQIDTTNRLNAWTSAQINMTAVFAQLESDMARDRMRERVAAKDAIGLNHGKPPFGMTRTGEGNAARFAASPDIGAVIRCLELYAGGASYDEAAARLNRDTVSFRDRAGQPCAWGRESVRTVVGNVLRYAGFHIPQTGYDAKSNRVELADGDGDHVDRWARAIGAWRSPAVDEVIERQLANAVIDRRHKNQFTGRPAHRVYLLTPILYWRSRKLRGHPSTDRHFYRTYGSGAAFDADEVESRFLHRVEDLRMTAELREGMRQLFAARTNDGRMQSLNDRLVEAREARATLVDLLIARQIDREAYNSRFSKFESIIRECETEMSAPVEVENAIRVVSDVGATVMRMTPEKQKRAIHKLFQRIMLSDDGDLAAADWKPWTRYMWGLIRGEPPFHTNDAEGGHSGQRLYGGVPQLPSGIPAPIALWARLPTLEELAATHTIPTVAPNN